MSKRAILVTGKGGVGKTTLAAAVARFAVSHGKRVLVAEIAADGVARQSPVSEALGCKESSEKPVEISPGLRTVLLTPSAGHRRFLQDILPVKLLADAAMRSTAVRRFLSAAPACAEMGVLYRILDLLQEKRRHGFEHELCVVDCPATGHTLALTQLPELLLKIVGHGPIGKAVREGIQLLTNPHETAALVVTLPESLPVSEALELVKGLARHRVPLAGMVANRVPPNPFSSDERAQVELLNVANGPLVGLRALRRLDRAQVALAKLGQAALLPIYTVPEVMAQGASLAEQVALALASFVDADASCVPRRQ